MNRGGRPVGPGALCAGVVLCLLSTLPLGAESPGADALPPGDRRSVPGGILGGAVRSFRAGNYAESQVQLERALEDNAALSGDRAVLRLRVFLALAHRHGDLADRWLRSSRETEKDPLLLYQLAWNRLRFREYDQAAILFERLLAGQKRREIDRSLREGRWGAGLPGVPLRCPSDDAAPSRTEDATLDGRRPESWLEIEEALADPGRAAEVWDASPGPVHYAVADLMRRAFGKSSGAFDPGARDSDSKPSSPVPSTAPAVDAAGDAAGRNRALLALLLDPGRDSILRCLGPLPETASIASRSDENRARTAGERRLLSALLLRYDASPQAALSVGFRFLESHQDDGAASGALEALHALRLAYARLPAAGRLSAASLNPEQRAALDLRLLVLRQLARTYRRLGRAKQAAGADGMAGLLERYLARGEAFPLQALRDLAGENLRFREGLLLGQSLAADEAARNRYRLLLQQYDHDRDIAEGQALFRTLYRYE